MSAPKTQLAWAGTDEHGIDVRNLATGGPDIVCHLPVLVVPEAAVSKCKHTMAREDRRDWCSECGSHETINGRWQRPRGLRVGRAK
jgi:hypothetical protein